MDLAAAPEVSAASPNIIRLNGIEVATDLTKPHVININFNQSLPPSRLRDFFDSLAQSLNTLGGHLTPNARASVMPPVSIVGILTEVKTALEVSQIMAGLTAISLGVILCLIVNPGLTSSNGTAFWTGFPLIISGVISLVKEKRNSSLWAMTALLMSFTCFVLALVGIVLVAMDLSIYTSSYYYSDYLTLLKSVKTLLLLDIVFGLITGLGIVGCDVWVWNHRTRPGQGEEAFGMNGSQLHLPPSLLPPAYEEMPRNMHVV